MAPRAPTVDGGGGVTALRPFDPDRLGSCTVEQIVFGSDGRKKLGFVQLKLYNNTPRRARKLVEDLADFARISLERKP